MATDGLFDNVDVEDIAAHALEWERENHYVEDKGRTGRNKSLAGNSITYLSANAIPTLADTLCRKSQGE